jgi:hypothetical protein
MKKILIFIPILFLAALVAIAAMLYTNTGERTGCTGAECDTLNDSDYIDKVLDARS